MAEHILKVVPPYFDSLLDGSKTFEVRANDRAYQKGDRLVLWEFNPAGERRSCDRYPCERCRPRAVTATAGFVYSGDPRHGMCDALNLGYVVLSLLDVQEVSRACLLGPPSSGPRGRGSGGGGPRVAGRAVREGVPDGD